MFTFCIINCATWVSVAGGIFICIFPVNTMKIAVCASWVVNQRRDDMCECVCMHLNGQHFIRSWQNILGFSAESNAKWWFTFSHTQNIYAFPSQATQHTSKCTAVHSVHIVLHVRSLKFIQNPLATMFSLLSLVFFSLYVELCDIVQNQLVLK